MNTIESLAELLPHQEMRDALFAIEAVRTKKKSDLQWLNCKECNFPYLDKKKKKKNICSYCSE